MTTGPLIKSNIVKKRTRKFTRYESGRYVKLKSNWRKPNGINNRVMRRFKGQYKMPTTGHGTWKTCNHVCPGGFKEVLVHNVRDLEVLLKQNWAFSAETAHNVSSRKRKDVVERAQELVFKMTSPIARLRQKEDE